MLQKTKELTIPNETKGFMMLKNFDANETIAKEMEGLTTVFEKIKMPSGDTTVFQMPSENPEEPEIAKEFSAVILYHHPIRAFFKTKYTGAIVPPDCGSLNAIDGSGNPGGKCENCVNNIFGTGENGSKACKEKRRLYLLREGEMFPIMLSLPTGSLKDFSRYLIRCLSKGHTSNTVVTKFSLAKTTNKSGMAYAKAVFRMERKLSEDEINLISKMSEEIKAISRKIGFEDINKANAESPEIPEITEQNSIIPVGQTA